jgi:hypothetical protein
VGLPLESFRILIGYDVSLIKHSYTSSAKIESEAVLSKNISTAALAYNAWSSYIFP